MGMMIKLKKSNFSLDRLRAMTELQREQEYLNLPREQKRIGDYYGNQKPEQE